MARLSLRRFGVVLMSALVLATSFSHLAAPPARADVSNVIAADAGGDPIEEIYGGDELWAYATSASGGFVCIKPAVPFGEAYGGCDGGGAYSLIPVPPLWAGYLPIAAGNLKPGDWMLVGAAFDLSPSARSQQFHVTLCTDCVPDGPLRKSTAFKTAASVAIAALSHICDGLDAWAVAKRAQDIYNVEMLAFAEGGLNVGQLVVSTGFNGGIIVWELTAPEPGPLGAAMWAFCSLFSGPVPGAPGINGLLDSWVNDPPNPDFRALFEPVFIDPGLFPVGEVELGVPAGRLGVLTNAALVTYERYQGAIDAGDGVWASRQVSHLSDLTQAISSESLVVADQMDSIAAALVAADPDPAHRSVSSDEYDLAVAARASLAASGFTASERQQALDLGLTDGWIDWLEQELSRPIAGSPVRLPFDGLLTDGATALRGLATEWEKFSRQAAIVAARDAADTPPVASFTANTTSGFKPLDVTFTDTSTDADGDPLTYQWNFDDGTTSTEASPVHTFTDARTYFVRLDVSDGQAGSVDTAVITVTPPGTPPTAYFTVPKYTYLVGDTIHLTDQSADAEGPIASRFWSDPYGIFSEHSASETDFTFTSAVTSKIRLDVTDSDGWTASYERAVTSFTSLPIPSLGGCSTPIAGSGLDSVGNEFMLAFPGNFQDFPNSLYLFIASDVPTSGFVEVPGLGFEQDFSVTPGTATQVVIPPEAHLIGSDLVTANGIRVCADHEVSVYGDNERGASTDAYLGLPTDVVGTDYVVMSYPADVPFFEGERSQLDFVGNADGTNVQITPSIDVGGHPAGVPFTVDLGRFMTYQLKADLDDQDLTGTIIHADHPIGVFGGDSCTDVPAGVAACDHMVEQLAPTRTWGTNFSIVALAGRTGGDLVRVLASQAGTQVVLDGSVAATVGPGQFVEFDLASASTHEIQTTKPSLVAQFGKSLGADGATGDPFMATVSPNEQFADHYTMVSLPGFSNYLNLVIGAADVDSCLLDGAGLTGAMQPIGATGQIGLRQAVDPGSHVVTCPNPFGIMAYGWAVFESYGYPGGSRLASIGENQPPVGTPDSYSGPQDTNLVVSAATGVLANDSDPDGDALTATKASDPGHGSLTLNANGSFTYTPNVGYVGSDSFTYTAGDGTASSAVTLVSLTIGRTNHAPTLTAIDDSTIPEVVPFSLTLAGSDPDGDAPLTYTAPLRPLGVAVDADTGILAWTPTEAQGPGDYPVTVRVTDPGGLFAERSFTIHVLEVNRDPALAPIADQTVNPGEAVSLTAIGSDPDLPANTLTYSLVGGPAGATVGTTSGAFAWTASSTLGDYPVTIGVSDGAGGSAERSFTIQVVRDTTSLAIGGDIAGQYSDTATITATLKVGSTPVVGATVSISLGAADTNATTNASGVASATFTIPGPAGTLPIIAAFAGTASKFPSSTSGMFTINREDASLVYAGDTIGLVGTSLHLAATFTDSAAAGYAGPNPETGAGATIGDLTKAKVAFAIYGAATCLSGAPVTTLSAFVTDTGTTGDGIGTAAVTWSSASEGTFCIVPSLVGASGLGSNGYYTAGPAEPAGLAVLSGLSNAHLWLGLRNSDDQGTQFDVKVELFRNTESTPVASGLTRCVSNLSRNPMFVKDVTVHLDPFSPASLDPGDVLSIVISTRIGTNGDDTKCPGPGGSHNNAVGLRFYYDAVSRNSRLDATIGSTSADLYFHSDGGGCDKPSTKESQGVITRSLNASAPTATLVKCKDSGHLNFAGGNAFREIGTWTLP